MILFNLILIKLKMLDPDVLMIIRINYYVEILMLSGLNIARALFIPSSLFSIQILGAHIFGLINLNKWWLFFNTLVVGFTLHQIIYLLNTI